MKTDFVKLGSVCKVLSGFAFDSSQFNSEGNGMPLVRIRDVGYDATETFFAGSYSDAFIVRKGDFLVTMDGEFRIAEWVGSDGLLNQRVCKVVFDEKKINKRFGYYYLPRELKKIEDQTPFVTVRHLSVKKIEAIEVPLPPLPIQKKIAAILDKADGLRQKDKQLLQYFNELSQSIFYEMFGDPVKNEKSWDMASIRDIVDDVKYGTSKPAEEGGEYPYLRMNNITYEGEWDFSNLKFINLTESEKDKYLLKRGDLVFNRTNSKELVGKTAVYKSDQNMAVAGYLIRVRTNERAITDYLSAFLNSSHGKAILRGMCKNIIGMANINAQELQDIQLPVPPIKFQLKFKERIEKIASQKKYLTEQRKHSDLLFQSLLQKAFKGELVKEP